jgi:hypothetical protein
MSDAPRIDPDNPPAHIVEEVLEHNPPVPWQDPFYDGNDGEEEVWPPRRTEPSAWDGKGWPGPEHWWP